jgi:hypothetical protein
MRAVIAGVEKRHGDIFAREIDHRCKRTFAEFQGIAAFANDGSGRADNPCSIRFPDLDVFCHSISPSRMTAIREAGLPKAFRIFV